MRDLSSRLKNRVINYSDLIRYGFNKNEERYVYMQNIYNNQFKVIVEIKNDKMIS